MNDIELKRKRIEAFVKWAAIFIGCFLIGPFVGMAIKGAIGLLAFAVIALIAVNLAPWFGSKCANWRLKALKHEAALNPIETLQNSYQSKMQALQTFRDYIRNFAGEVGLFKDKLSEFKQRFPKDSQKFDDQFSQMRTLLEFRKNKYEEAKENLSLFESEIEKVRAIWEMAQAAAKMNRAAGVNTDDFYAKIQEETALDSVQKSLNSAFADLEISLLDEEKKSPKRVNVENVESKQLGDKPDTLDLCLDVIPERVYQ